MMFPLFCFADDAQDNYFNNYDIIFTARHTQAGKSKRYMIEDIYKGSVDKKIMDYVLATPDFEDNASDGLVLFMFKTKPVIGVVSSVVDLKGETSAYIEGRWIRMSLDEVRKCIENKAETEVIPNQTLPDKPSPPSDNNPLEDEEK
jgi:hypothetical protein